MRSIRLDERLWKRLWKRLENDCDIENGYYIHALIFGGVRVP